jgi:hypothetical protein
MTLGLTGRATGRSLSRNLRKAIDADCLPMPSPL